MTEKSIKYGCLSKALDKFLSMKDDKRRKKEYGNVTAAKYYERIVKEVNGSFDDHAKIIRKIPESYRKKINFMAQYNQIITDAVTHQWINEHPDKLLKETRQHMVDMRRQLHSNKELDLLAGKDFDKIVHWLNYMIELKSN